MLLLHLDLVIQTFTPKSIRLKYKISPLIFNVCSSQCVLSREPDFVQSCSLTIFKTLQWFISLTKQTQNSLASHVRFWYQYKNCFPIFISNHKSLTLWAHWITLHFPNVLSTLLSLSLCLCHSFYEGWNSLPLLFQSISYLDLPWNVTMDLEVCVEVWEFGKYVTWINSEFLTSCVAGWQQGCIF